jgi:hypothetical protein
LKCVAISPDFGICHRRKDKAQKSSGTEYLCKKCLKFIQDGRTNQTEYFDPSILYVNPNICLEHLELEPENPYANLVDDQSIVIVPEFELESGVVLQQVPVAYKTWGKLNAERSNVLIICHALSGSADVEDW